MGPKLKILLAGDRAAERDAMALAIEQRGFDPRVSSTFELPFAAAHEQPDLLVFDTAGLRPAEVARVLREAAAGCPVILLTDPASASAKDMASACAGATCIEKTGSPEALMNAVAPLLLRQRDAARAPPLDFVAMARRSTREQFVTAAPFPFLVSGASFVSQADVESTADILDPEMLQAVQAAVYRETGIQKGAPRRFVDTGKPNIVALAIRSSSDAASDTITVGRGHGVDVFIDHATISKLHARFVRAGKGLRLADAGSRNGTWVSGRLLSPNGPPSGVVESQDTVRFGELEFTFLSSTAAWDVLRVNVR